MDFVSEINGASPTSKMLVDRSNVPFHSVAAF